MKATEQNFHLHLPYYKNSLSTRLRCWDVPVVLPVYHAVQGEVLTHESVDKILNCERSNESY